MSNSPLRLEQYDTVLYNANLNPMGIPSSVIKAIEDNKDCIVRYPGDYYDNLKKALAAYAECDKEHLILGSGSTDLLRLFTALLMPKKALLIVPSFSEYENVLKLFGCEIDYYCPSEENDYRIDVVDFVSKLDSSYDTVILGNPNNPTSQIILRDDIEIIADACKKLDIFLIIDEMYIEFTANYKELTSVPLTKTFSNIAVLRSVSKFFAVPGLRLAYAIMNNPENMEIINITSTQNSLSTLTAAACTEMLKDKTYIEESRSQIYTERNLIFSAMSTNKNIHLFRPYANFMLVKILKEDVTANQIAEHCNLKGIVIRNCENFRGLSDKYIRFCFMKPKQNDLLVNTILELL